MRYLPLLLLAILFWSGCAASDAARSAAEADAITVEGTVTHRGNAPFTTYVLETDQRNSYILNLEGLPEERQSFTTPLRARVTGTLYADTWGDRSYAHLRVTTMQDLADAGE